jgi:hypothetical protein
MADVGGNALNAYVNYTDAGNATDEAVQGQNNALIATYGAQQSAVAAEQPYYNGGLTDYDILQYGITGNSNTGNVQPLTQDQTNQIQQLQDYINNYGSTRGGQSGKYAGALADAESQLSALQSQQQTYQSQQQAQAGITNSGMQAGGLMKMLDTPFSYNVNTDPNLQAAATWANGNIASQNAAAGNYGSGAMASALNQEDVGTLESQYYNQALQNYQTNGPTMASNIVSLLEGNTSGAGGTTANALSNIYTGSALNSTTNALTGIGNSNASGTLGQGNAISNASTGASNGINSGIGTYLNNSSQSNLATQIQQLITKMNASGNSGSSGGSDILSDSGDYSDVYGGIGE